MSRSTPARLADLQRLKAWPFVSWCFVQRHLVPDLELLLAKPSGCGLPVEWAANDPDSAAAIAEAAAVLGWSANWLRQVRLLAASHDLCLHTGKRSGEPTSPTSPPCSTAWMIWPRSRRRRGITPRAAGPRGADGAAAVRTHRNHPRRRRTRHRSARPMPREGP